MICHLKRLLGFAGAALFFASATAQVVGAQTYNEQLFKGLKYRLVGPYRGGRSLTGVGVPSEPNTYYFGAVAGGVWKTTNGGMSWTPLFDKQSVASIGSVAVADSDPNVLYVGTGEACIRGNISFGDGVYKSTDAGKTWTNVGLKETRTIGRVIIHPQNPDVVFVAALGHAYGFNEERGVFRTLDGGKSWEKVLYVSDRAGAIDITFVPGNPHILFATTWEGWRNPWYLNSGGPGSGVWKSTDGGATWKRLTKGLPDLMGKIGVSISAANPERVYLIVEAKEELGGIYRSDNGGASFEQLTDDHRLRHRPWYYTHITADPSDAETVYVMTVGLYKSTDGGENWSPMSGIPHGDHHGLWIDPKDSRRMINVNDGGATITVDGGESWSRQDNQPTAQFYHVTTDNDFPYRVYGSQQDNSSVSIASRADDGSIGREDYHPVGGGEAGYIAPDPNDPNIVYAGEYFGIITRWDKRTNQAQNIMVWPDDVDGHEAADVKYRFNWTEPIHMSKHRKGVLWQAGNILFQSTNGGMSWTAISPDLTRNDKSKQQRSGGPITDENITVEYYNVIFSFAESPAQENLLWVGTDDGLIHLTRDGGKNWTNVTPPDLPEGIVSILDASPVDAATAYFALDRHKFDDLTPYIYRTHDYGKSWTRINNGIPNGTFVRAVRVDPKRKGLLYAGAETGMYVSFDDGENWQSLQLNLPMVPIHDLVVKDNDLVVATHGRSFWILDNLEPLRHLSDQVAQAEVHLFTPSPAYRFRGGGGFARGGFAGENPPSGAILYYYLKAKPSEEITLEILNSKEEIVRRYSSVEKKEEGKPLPERPRRREGGDVLPTEPGMHRFIWNLRYDMPDFVPSVIWDFGPPSGPLALPGTYTVRLRVAGKAYAAPLEIVMDPRVKTPRADLEKQFALLMDIRKLIGDTHGGVMEIRAVRKQLADLLSRAGGANSKELSAAAEAVEQKMALVEAELIEVLAKSSQDMCNYPTKLSSKIAWLDNVVDSADAAPTQQSYEAFQWYRSWADRELGKWHDIVGKEVADLNRLVERQKIPAVRVPTSR